MRRAELPEHTCGWSPHYRRTVPNDECERCRAEDDFIFDTQRFDQRKRSWIYRPARASNAVSAIAITSDGKSTSSGVSVHLRRETFVAPEEGVQQ